MCFPGQVHDNLIFFLIIENSHLRRRCEKFLFTIVHFWCDFSLNLWPVNVCTELEVTFSALTRRVQIAKFQVTFLASLAV